MKVPVLFLAVFSAALAATQSQAGAPQVVVLRNGNVLEGEVDRLGDMYRIATQSSEIRLPARDVERIAPTLLDAYAARQQEVHDDSQTDRLELAIWCIRQELWPQAAAELQAAETINPRHPQIEYLKRRLEVASQAAMRAAVPVEAAQAEDRAVQAQQKAAELARLEALAAELPPGALEDFARHVQPILVNGCAAGGCHSTTDHRTLRLNRDLVRGMANRESTLRNLQAVWDSIDHQTPEHSPLLLEPSVPHGGLPQPVFDGPRQKVQEKLTAWVRMVTTPSPPSLDPASRVRLATHQSAAPAGPAVVDADSPDQRPRHFWEDPEAGGTASTADGPPVRRGAELKAFTPQDEFDPELFNRRQAGKANDSPADSANQ